MGDNKFGTAKRKMRPGGIASLALPTCACAHPFLRSEIRSAIRDIVNSDEPTAGAVDASKQVPIPAIRCVSHLLRESASYGRADGPTDGQTHLWRCEDASKNGLDKEGSVAFGNVVREKGLIGV